MATLISIFKLLLFVASCGVAFSYWKHNKIAAFLVSVAALTSGYYLYQSISDDVHSLIDSPWLVAEVDDHIDDRNVKSPHYSYYIPGYFKKIELKGNIIGFQRDGTIVSKLIDDQSINLFLSQVSDQTEQSRKIYIDRAPYIWREGSFINDFELYIERSGSNVDIYDSNSGGNIYSLLLPTVTEEIGFWGTRAESRVSATAYSQSLNSIIAIYNLHYGYQFKFFNLDKKTQEYSLIIARSEREEKYQGNIEKFGDDEPVAFISEKNGSTGIISFFKGDDGLIRSKKIGTLEKRPLGILSSRNVNFYIAYRASYTNFFVKIESNGSNINYIPFGGRWNRYNSVFLLSNEFIATFVKDNCELELWSISKQKIIGRSVQVRRPLTLYEHFFESNVETCLISDVYYDGIKDLFYLKFNHNGEVSNYYVSSDNLFQINNT